MKRRNESTGTFSMVWMTWNPNRISIPCSWTPSVSFCHFGTWHPHPGSTFLEVILNCFSFVLTQLIVVGVVGRNLNHARHKSSDVESVKVRKETKMADTDERLKYLKALISQAKHKADTVS